MASLSRMSPMDEHDHLFVLALGRPLALAAVVAGVCAILIGLLGSWNFFLIMALIPRGVLTVGVFWILHAVATRAFGSAWISWGCAILTTASVVGGTLLAIKWNPGMMNSPPPPLGAPAPTWFSITVFVGSAAVPAIIARYWLAEY